MSFLAGCGNNDEPRPEPAPDDQDGRKRTILVYAVASNNLVNDFYADCEEMLVGMRGIDKEQYTLLVYRVLRNGSVSLLEVQDGEKGLEFVTVKEYDNETLSTDPDRLKEVIADVRELRPARNYGLIFWAHGSSWEPGNNEHDRVKSPVYFAYGGDQTSGVTDWMNIDEMAEALPNNGFEFIWFDNCFMSSIEVLYELRDKASYIVAYPTEIYSPGSPYHNTLPFLMQPKLDLVGAAKETFDQYNLFGEACTIAVMDMSKIEPVAEAVSKSYLNFKLVNTSGLQRYDRFSYGPYFDFRQLTVKIGENSPVFSISELDDALDDFVIYKDCSEKNFKNQPIDKDNYSGISAHAYKVYTKNDDYFRQLDWYERVCPGL